MKTNEILINGFSLSWYTKNNMKSFLKKIGSSFGFVIILMPIFGIILSIGNATKVDFLKEIGSILFANIGIWFTLAIIIGFTSNKGVAVYSGILSYLVVNVFISSFIREVNSIYFNIWFWKNLNKSALLSKLFFGGIETFNSGVIGGILIGVYVTYIYNKFKETNLPKGLEFFSKERFTILLSILFSFIFASLFIIIWPLIGFCLSAIGIIVANSPIGMDSFIFRTIQRMLIPFGSSLLWQSPMWYTQIGGELNLYQQDLLIQYLFREVDSEHIYLVTKLSLIPVKGIGESQILDLFKNELEVEEFKLLEDKINLWFENTNSIFEANPSGDQIIWNIVSTNKYITVDDCWNAGLRVSRFISGGYINSIFVLPTLSLTMLLMTPKGEKRAKTGIYITAALTAMLIGVTEPVEYLFCFTMPLFYFAIYCPFNGLIAMTTSLLKVKVGTSFSTGIFDFTLSGIIPTINGVNTRIWIIPIIGIIASSLIFTIAYFWFKYSSKLEKKTNFEAKNLKESFQNLIITFGGIKNIEQFVLKEDQAMITFIKLPSDLISSIEYKEINITDKTVRVYFNDNQRLKYEVLEKVYINIKNPL
ncbi:PTS transporter subunit EIIC [Spiroplasma diminutum]|uniref:PTS system glucose-specific IIBC component n=1 Tax=Spiroplasma diminutum CUAS-1 TaxID=1276221 RepID=S5LZR8_9MOLU|nr:PTS transporter subunit EIIC [Spiroplasma diminutum]AGR42101.1 PTS system glucose-specific IIBC component [Spiroplasma diminutum CUAS-1]